MDQTCRKQTGNINCLLLQIKILKKQNCNIINNLEDPTKYFKNRKIFSCCMENYPFQKTDRIGTEGLSIYKPDKRQLYRLHLV